MEQSQQRAANFSGILSSLLASADVTEFQIPDLNLSKLMYNIVQQSKEEKNIKVGNISSNLSA
jgi:hypothetical protein